MNLIEESPATWQEGRPFWQGIERNEMEYWRALYRDKEAAARHFSMFSGAAACSMPSVDILAFNRVLGLGQGEAVHPRQMEAIIGYYRRRGVSRFFAPLSPTALPSDAGAILESAGFEKYNAWAKLVRDLSRPVPEVDTELEIIDATPGWSGAFSEVLQECFRWPPAVGHAFGETIGKPGYQHYLALAGGRLAAVAALYARPPFASMAIAATLPEFRGMGAQSALLARRMETARQLGCRYAVVETAAEQPGKIVQSYRNVQRLGFQLAYLRPNYLYQF